MTLVALVSFVFVDNTDLFLAGKTEVAMEEDMVAEFQEALDRWRGEIIATGGALSSIKSFCYLIDFV